MVLVHWLASAFLSLFLFFLRLLSDLPSLGIILFCRFVLLCLLALPFAFCVYRSLPMFYVSTLCLSPVLVFVRPLVFVCLSLGSFLFSFPLFRSSRYLPPFIVAFLWLLESQRIPCVNASIMACIVGARRMLPWSAVVFTESGDEDEQFSLKRRRFELGHSFFNLATGIIISCNQALIHGKFFLFLIWPLDQLQIDPYIVETFITQSMVLNYSMQSLIDSLTFNSFKIFLVISIKHPIEPPSFHFCP